MQCLIWRRNKLSGWLVGCAARIKSVNVSSCSAAASSVLRLPNKCSGHSEEELRFVFRVEVFSEVDSYLRCKLVMLCVHYAVTERCRGLEVEMIVPLHFLLAIRLFLVANISQKGSLLMLALEKKSHERRGLSIFDLKMQAHLYYPLLLNQIKKRRRKMCSDLVWFPWFLKRNPLPKFFLGTIVCLILLLIASTIALPSAQSNTRSHTFSHLLLCRFIGLKEGKQQCFIVLTLVLSPAHSFSNEDTIR